MVDLSTGGYAATADLTAWMQPTALPANAAHLLRSASVLVARACMRNLYTDTPATAELAPLRDATCAQAASWAASGIDPDKLGLDPASAPVKKSSILTGDVERDTTAQSKAALEAVDGLCEQACAILTVTGLIFLPMPLGDPAPYLLSYGQPAAVPLWGYDQAVDIDAYGFGPAGWPFL